MPVHSATNESVFKIVNANKKLLVYFYSVVQLLLLRPKLRIEGNTNCIKMHFKYIVVLLCCYSPSDPRDD